MLAVRLTAPGVPDLYQGTEAFRYLLVDPDNRGEPDHAALDDLVARAATLDGRAAWAEEGRRPRGRSSSGACCRPAISSTSPATSRSTPAPT